MGALNRRQILNIFLLYLKNRRKKLSLMNTAIAILLHFEEKRNLIVRPCLFHIETIYYWYNSMKKLNVKKEGKHDHVEDSCVILDGDSSTRYL